MGKSRVTRKHPTQTHRYGKKGVGSRENTRRKHPPVWETDGGSHPNTRRKHAPVWRKGFRIHEDMGSERPRVWEKVGVEKKRFRETMLDEFSTVDFALSGSY